MTTKKETGNRRLKTLATFLNSLPKETELNMATWNRHHDCGFAGCAIGHALHHKVFLSSGLKFDEGKTAPIHDDYAGYLALWSFFSITDREVRHLFSPEDYQFTPVTPAYVAHSIEDFLSQQEPTS